MILALASLGVALFIYYCLLIVYMVYRGANYVVTPPEVIRDVIALIQPGDVFVDLGFGHGELLEAALLAGASQAIGYELDIQRYIRTLIRLQPRFGSRVKLVYGDVRLAHLSNADVVYTFFSPHHMCELYIKAKREMKRGSWFVSYVHSVPGTKPTRSHGKLYLYRIGT